MLLIGALWAKAKTKIFQGLRPSKELPKPLEEPIILGYGLEPQTY